MVARQHDNVKLSDVGKNIQGPKIYSYAKFGWHMMV